MLLRTATSADAPAIAALHAHSWQLTYRGAMTDHYLDQEAGAERLQAWTDRFARQTPEMQVSVPETATGELMGFSCVFPDYGADGHLLDNLHVGINFQGSGLGKELMQNAARRLLESGHTGEIFLWVLTSNIPAIGFYEKMGGRRGRTASQPFPGGQTVEALMMSWPLNELANVAKPDYAPR